MVTKVNTEREKNSPTPGTNNPPQSEGNCYKLTMTITVLFANSNLATNALLAMQR